MTKLFAPYTGREPAPVIINGHRLLIVSKDRNLLGDALEMIGGDCVRSLKTVHTSDEEEKLLGELAQKTSAGIVVAPNDIEMKDLIRSLENELPWVQ